MSQGNLVQQYLFPGARPPETKSRVWLRELMGSGSFAQFESVFGKDTKTLNDAVRLFSGEALHRWDYELMQEEAELPMGEGEYLSPEDLALFRRLASARKFIDILDEDVLAIAPDEYVCRMRLVVQKKMSDALINHLTQMRGIDFDDEGRIILDLDYRDPDA